MASGSSTSARIQATVPLIVDSIISCKQQQFHVCDTPVHIVCLVGVIRKLQIESCEVSCEIQDHSGSVKGVMMLETQSEVSVKLSGITENHYAKVFGSVRTENASKVLFIMRMFPVDDCNIITHHLLQFCAFVVGAQAERNKRLVSANTSGTALADSLVMSEEMDAVPTTQFTDFQKLVFDIVKSDFSEIGITRRGVLRQFPAYQGTEVNGALDFLVNEGIIYHSIDQEHLKAA